MRPYPLTNNLVNNFLVSPTPTHSQDSFTITLAPLSVASVYELADDPGNGAVVMMSGTVRNQTEGKPVLSLEYQAYEPMAIAVFRSIAQQIRDTWKDVNRVVIHHRIGHLTIGEISVVVAVGCPHRSEAFAACQYAMDTLKYNAPIWKKEHNIVRDETTGEETVVGTWVKLSECC